MIDSPIITTRSNGIDALRAILALWVIFSHLSRWTFHVQGDYAHSAFIYLILSGLGRVFQTCGETHPAVLGFIVLSGYCIHRNGLRRDGMSASSYFIRRAFRIYPIYFFAILFGMVCFTLCLHVSPEVTAALSGTSELSLKYAALKVLGLSSFIPSLNENTFQGNAPLHTVMVEIWLYVLYPILILGVLKRYKEHVLWVMLVLIWGTGIAYISSHGEYTSWWHNGSVFGFVLYWWLGAKFTDSGFVNKVSPYYQGLILVWLSLTAILVLGWTDIVFIVELRKLFFALLFGIFVTKCDKVNIRYGLDKIGKAGYSIYALHAPLVYTLIILWVPWPLVCISVLLLGMLVYRFYEYPFLRFGKRIAESL